MGCCPPNPFSGDFNSRPSARGDRLLLASACVDCISIHAPPRGATQQRRAQKNQPKFQFTPLREGRRRDGGEVLRRGAISIHAPPRGATRRYVRRLEVQYQFQFTPLREGRRGATGTALYRDNFNSRPSARGDDRKREFAERVLLFQFTPLREGRPPAACKCMR